MGKILVFIFEKYLYCHRCKMIQIEVIRLSQVHKYNFNKEISG